MARCTASVFYSLLLTPEGPIQFVGVCDDDERGVEFFIRLIAGHMGLHVS